MSANSGNVGFILVVNVGSTSLKFQAFAPGNGISCCRGNMQRVFSGQTTLEYHKGDNVLSEVFDTVSGGYHTCMERMLRLLMDRKYGILDGLEQVEAIGFKAVHGGRFNFPVLVTEEVLEQMRSYTDAAPAHNPPYIKAMEMFARILPGIPLVAVFETSFHRDIPQYLSCYATPHEWHEKYGARRYGFHGASHTYIAMRTKELAGPEKSGKIISCHLGGSSSVCAISDGKSLYCSMGFSPQSGLPMASRCGDIDPFLLLRVMEREHYSPQKMREVLSGHCGLLGMSGVSGDIRDLRADSSERAELALRTFAFEVKKQIGCCLALLNGADALCFTGGIGENDASFREMICADMEMLGISLDPDKNEKYAGDSDISEKGSATKVWVIHTDEERVVAEAVKQVLKGKRKNVG